MSHQGLAMATAVKEVLLAHKQGGKTDSGKCFKCDQMGHFARDCPTILKLQQNNPRPKPTSLCPKCRRGYHWANECKSKTDADSNPLSQQGNGVQSPPRTPNWRQTPGAIGFVPQRSNPTPTHNPTQNNPFQVSSVLHEEVQDWTSVPPSTQY